MNSNLNTVALAILNDAKESGSSNPVSMVFSPMGDGTIALNLSGWYKNGEVSIFAKEGVINRLYVHGRYNEIGDIVLENATPDDIMDQLAHLNFYEYLKYQSKHSYSLDECYVRRFEKLGLIRKVTNYEIV